MGLNEIDSASAPNPTPEPNSKILSRRKIWISAPLWPGIWLAIVLITCKAILFHNLSGWPYWFIVSHPDQLQMPTYQDTAFAFILTLLGAGAILALARLPRIQRSVWILFISFCTLCVFFSVCSYPAFEYLRTPLSINLIRAAGDLNGIRTSISGYVSDWEITMLVLVPALYLIVSILSNRYLPIRSSLLLVLVLLGIGGLITAQWLLSSRRLASDKWSLNGSQAIAMNPQWIMLASIYEKLTDTGSVTLVRDFPAEYLDDFKPAPLEPPRAFSPRPRNVILVVLESTSTRYLGVYGSQYDTTPQLDAERRHCLFFDNFYAHVGQTAISLLALTTSRYPSFRYAHSPLADRAAINSVSAARVLQSDGYRTAFISASPLDFLGQDKFLATQGYDRLEDPSTFGCPKIFAWGVRDACMMDHLIGWIGQNPTRPFFAVAWTIQTHAPYEPTPGKQVINFVQQDGSNDRASLNRYLNAMREADTQIGRLFAALRQRHLAKDTVVIITGDHGEAFGELHNSHFHGLNLFEEDIHVPLIVWSPALFNHESHSDTVGGHLDIGPTILDLLGFDVPAGVQGRSLFDPSRVPRIYFFQNKAYLLFGLRSGNWKYIYNSVTGKQQLFDLKHDPHEQTNAAATFPALSHEFRQRIAAWIYCQTHR
ncbi:MAG TPA: sulfatase [Tepidisphaeraceae bacterium]|jgi:phosphoglycerol transferase MdoB-like AlkP superfamily enzyme|nr:sulfatase [Tepidisphaeraceae bacterium]